MLAEIYNWFTEGFDTADLKEAKAVLDELGRLPVAEYLVLVSGLSLCSIAAMRETRYSELGAVAPSGAQPELRCDPGPENNELAIDGSIK
jgi:hypothetical protein